MRSRVLKTTVLAAVAGAVGAQVPQVALHLRRLSYLRVRGEVAERLKAAVC